MSTERPGIYSLRNRHTDMVYVGGARNMSKRWHRHRKGLATGTHANKRLQADYDRSGAETFEYTILELVTNVSALRAREQAWIDKLKAANPSFGYNVHPLALSAKGAILGPRSPEMRKRQSAWLKGKCGMGIASPIRQGADNHASKVNPDIVRQIRQLYGVPAGIGGKGRPHERNGGCTYASLGRRFGLKAPAVHDIVHRKTWRHVK